MLIYTFLYISLNSDTPLYRDNDPIFKMAAPIKPHEEGSYLTRSLLDTRLNSDSPNLNVDSVIKTEQDNSANKLASSVLSHKPKSDCASDGHYNDSEDTEDYESEVPVVMPSHEGGVEGEGNMPGWFGKGCRKKVVRKVGKKRRRSRVSSVEIGT